MRKYSRLLLLFVSVCICFSCSDPAPVEYPYTLIPGIGLEEISLGATGEQVKQVFGDALHRSEEHNGEFRHHMEYIPEGLKFYFDPTNSSEIDLSLEITEIVAYGKYAGNTDKDIILGDSQGLVHLFYGDPTLFDEALNQDQYASGIIFCYDSEGYVSLIKIKEL